VFSGVSQRWNFKSTTKNVLQKDRVEKVYKKNDKKSETVFFSVLFLSRLWLFLGEGSLKTLPKICPSKNKSDPILFWPLTHPSTTGVTFCFGGPSHFPRTYFLLRNASARPLALSLARAPLGPQKPHIADSTYL
jgi:hypothetical protein